MLFEYEATTCRGTVEEGAGGVMRCVGPPPALADLEQASVRRFRWGVRARSRLPWRRPSRRLPMPLVDSHHPQTRPPPRFVATLSVLR